MVELGVSKGVMREALRILEQQGLVEVRRGRRRRPRVRHPSIAEASMAVRHLPAGRRGAGGRRLALPRPARRRRDRAPRATTAPTTTSVARRGGRPSSSLLVGDFDAYYGQLLDVGETVVELSGSRTDAALVAALRHIMAAELEAATRDGPRRPRSDVAVATAGRGRRSRPSWRDVVRDIRRRGPGAPGKRSSARPTLILDAGFRTKLDAETVLDVFGEARDPLLRRPDPPRRRRTHTERSAHDRIDDSSVWSGGACSSWARRRGSGG